jgi:GNAT superfamily N-acetyltransferase
VEFIESLNYEDSVREIKENMISYYVENDLTWDDDSKLEQYREECDLWEIRDNEDIGFLMTHENNGEFYLAELHIAAQHRGKGHGSMALKMASDYAARLGHEEIRIRVLKNSPAYRLYLRSGCNLEKELPYTYQLVAKTHNKERQSNA